MSCGCGGMVKYPVERKRYTIDYERWLEEGEQLSAFAVVVSPVTSPALVPEATFVEPGNLRLSTYFSGGVGSTFYNVQFIATTDLGQIKRTDVQVQVMS